MWVGGCLLVPSLPPEAPGSSLLPHGEGRRVVSAQSGAVSSPLLPSARTLSRSPWLGPGWLKGAARTRWRPGTPPLGRTVCLRGVDADTGRTSGDRCRDTGELGRQQVCYLSQSEGEDLASRPCRTRGCPRQEGTQGLRSLWAKRTELLRRGGRAATGTATQRWGVAPTRQECQLSGGVGVQAQLGHLPALLPELIGGTESHQWHRPHPQACLHHLSLRWSCWGARYSQL